METKENLITSKLLIILKIIEEFYVLSRYKGLHELSINIIKSLSGA